MRYRLTKTRGAGRRTRRGMTLIEAVLAIAVLAIGFVGIVSLLTSVSAAGRKSAFHNIALDVFTAFAAQVQNAHCDFAPNSTVRDSGLGTCTSGCTWTETAVTSPVASSITLVGLIDATKGATSPVTLAYSATQTPGDCTGGAATCTYPDRYRIDVQICDLSDPNRPCTLNAASGYGTGYWIRSFELTKTCTIRLDDNGRGEFY